MTAHTPPTEGIRLNKRMADLGLCSRREADDWIDKGWVKVNGQVAVMGLRVTPSDRMEVLPQVPTFTESGLPGYESIAWWGVMAPADVARPIIGKLNVAIVKSLNATETKERLAAEGAEVAGNTPAAFGAFLKRETAKWSKVIQTSGIKIE